MRVRGDEGLDFGIARCASEQRGLGGRYESDSWARKNALILGDSSACSFAGATLHEGVQRSRPAQDS